MLYNSLFYACTARERIAFAWFVLQPDWYLQICAAIVDRRIRKCYQAPFRFFVWTWERGKLLRKYVCDQAAPYKIVISTYICAEVPQTMVKGLTTIMPSA